MSDKILNLFLTLPHSIDYVGYRFQLCVYEDSHAGPSVSYFLSECLHKKPKYKKQAFQAGYWDERNHNRHTDGIGTKFLIRQPIFDLSDSGLQAELERVKMKLELWRILEPEIEIPNTDYEEITDNIPSEARTIIVRKSKMMEIEEMEELDEFEQFAQI